MRMGRVERCPCCAGCIVGWAGARVTVPPARLAEMRGAVAALAEKGARCGSLCIRAPREHVTFELWPGDAAEFAGLLAHAEGILEMDRTLVRLLAVPRT